MASILLKTSKVFISLPNSAVHAVYLCLCAFAGESSDTGLDWKALGKGWVTGTHFRRVVLILHKSCVKDFRSVRIPGWMSESRGVYCLPTTMMFVETGQPVPNEACTALPHRVYGPSQLSVCWTLESPSLPLEPDAGLMAVPARSQP